MSDEQLLDEVRGYMETCLRAATLVHPDSWLACDLRGNKVILSEAMSGGFTANRVYGMALELHDELVERWGKRYLHIINRVGERVA